jgi:hypothetical protein
MTKRMVALTFMDERHPTYIIESKNVEVFMRLHNEDGYWTASRPLIVLDYPSTM